MATEVKGLWAYSTHPFGDPTLSAANNGSAKWVRGSTTPLDQKGSTGWLANLNGGAQTNDDWARVNIPVNEMHLPDFATAKWSYYMTTAQSFGVNIVIWAHDPTDFDKRAEITQLGSTVERTAGWNAHEFTNATIGMYFYGEGVSGNDVCEAAGTQYTWSQFISDALFKTWDIYRITLEYGWCASGSFSDVYVADVQLNGKMIPLKPSVEELAQITLDEQAEATRTIPTWTFGKPTLMAQGNGKALWVRGENAIASHQKGSTGWVAKLHAGVQTTWESAAEVYIPVNEMPLPDLEAGTTMWSYLMTATETAGVGMVVWVHDPTDFDKRAEISMLTEVGHVELDAGWNAHELAAGNKCVWYGEDTGTHGTTVTAGSPYNFSQFLTDDVFSTYTIYRISFAYGFQTGDYDFDPAYLADVKINGVMIPLEPTVAELLVTKNRVVATTEKTLIAASAYHATDVMSEAISGGTDWDFEFGITGTITQAIVTSQTTGMTDALVLHLYSAAPNCELDDHALNTSPVVGDLDDFIGAITFPNLSSNGGASFAVALNNASGVGLPLTFNTTTIYGVIFDVTGSDDFGDNTKLTISLTAEI